MPAPATAAPRQGARAAWSGLRRRAAARCPPRRAARPARAPWVSASSPGSAPRNRAALSSALRTPSPSVPNIQRSREDRGTVPRAAGTGARARHAASDPSVAVSSQDEPRLEHQLGARTQRQSSFGSAGTRSAGTSGRPQPATRVPRRHRARPGVRGGKAGGSSAKNVNVRRCYADPRHARKLHRTHPQGARLRRRHRVAARARPPPEPPARQRRSVQARGPAAGLLVQAARRLQQDRRTSTDDRREPRRDLRLRRQPRAGRGARGASARHHRGDRDAADHAGHQGAGGARPRRRGRAARRRLRPRLRACARRRARARAHVHPSLRRSGRHRGPGHDRHGDPAAGAAAAGRDLRPDRRRRPDRRHRGLRQVPVPAGPDHRRRARGRGQHARLAARGRARDARARRHLRGRRGRAPRRRRDLPPRAASTSTR